MNANWKKRFLAIILVTLVAAGCVALYRSGLMARFSSREELVRSLRSGGATGPLLCIAMQFVQVVIFFIPGEITQFAAGYVFGLPFGFTYSVVGIMLGSAFNFFFARMVGRPVVERFISGKTLATVDAALDSARGKAALFFLFLLPGVPKDALSYGAGFSAISLVEFVVITGLARSPALLLSVLLGSQAYSRNYRAMILTVLAAAAAVGLYYLYEYRRKRTAPPAS